MTCGERDLCSSTSIAGCTYCGVGVLRLLDRLPSTNIQEPNSSAEGFFNKTVNVQYLLRWLVNRQTLYIEEDEECSDLEGNCQPPSFQKEHSQSYASLKAQEPSIEPSLQELQCAGFNGRVDKVADTCYAFWVGGSLAVSCFQYQVFLYTSLKPSIDAPKGPSTRFQRHTEIPITEDAAYDRWFWKAMW